jgi:hypothetical protein
MSLITYTRTCLALAKMYADILYVNRREAREHFNISEIKKPLVELIYLGRALEDKVLSPEMRRSWAEVIANEMIAQAAKDIDNHYNIDFVNLKLTDREGQVPPVTPPPPLKI